MEPGTNNISEFKIVPGLMIHSKRKGKSEEVSAKHLGTVDRWDGKNYIKLSRTDSFDGENHWIPVNWIESCDENAVFLNVSEEEFFSGLIHKPPLNSENKTASS